MGIMLEAIPWINCSLAYIEIISWLICVTPITDLLKQGLVENTIASKWRDKIKVLLKQKQTY